ncbi:uncharacterized protein KY384_007081 [Bacidia gigantensis]|uniref:uncharacterized protein n=1 Tax=Bacidia gigantensis TaxID=2732470 RepID=UPI001D0516CE|nr:uncharacterized protein KY384_007081 [Bacidia gigantensis]KAG8528164.1 hypothetical protein KY384_007081 [Bacidia gigantensis]
MGRQSLKNVLLIGSSGQLAPHLIRELSASPHLALTVLSRSTPSSRSRNAKFITLPSPYKYEDLASCLKGKDAVVNLIPSGQFEITVIDLCIREGVKRYIPPEFGARTDNDMVVEKVPIVAMKKRVKDLLQSKEREGISWTGVVCGAFLDSGIKNGFLGFDIKNKQARLYDQGEHNMDVTLLSDVGKAVASILSDHPTETKNQYVYINTFLTSQNSVLKPLEKESGKFEISHAGAKEANEEGTARIKKGDFGGVKDSLMGRMASGKDGINGEGKHNELLLGRGTRGLEDLDGVVGDITRSSWQ